MDILDIYRKYKIMPQQAEHQLRVAAVAEFILNHSSLILDRRGIVAACLLHDMGNIIKYDLKNTNQMYPGLLKAGELEYWEGVKQEFINKYGSDEHHASVIIAQQVGSSERAQELVDAVGFNTGKINAESQDFGRKICAYSDMRVGPHGVISLEERMADLRARYDHKFHMMGGNEERRSEFENGLREIEQQIFEHCDIKPSDITEQVVGERMKILKQFQVGN